MGHILRFYLGVVFSISTIISGTSLAGDPFTMATLKQLIADNHVTTIEQLLPLLPTELRSSYTLVYNSQSTLQNGSPDNPRAILFGTNAKFILSFNGGNKNSHVKGGDEIEVMQFNDEKKNFEMFELGFERDKPVKISAENPAKCLTCHHINPRPIWTSYRSWPGVYGSDDDELSGFSGDKELIAFRKFRKATASNPRYQALDQGDQETFPYVPADGAGNFKNRPNLRMSKLLAQLNGERLIELIRKSPAYPQLRAQFLFTTYGCGDRSRKEMFDLISKTGIPLKEWVLTKNGSANPDGFDTSTDGLSVNTRIFFDGTVGIERYVARGVLADLSQDFTEIKSKFKELSDKEVYGNLVSRNDQANTKPLASFDATAQTDFVPQATCDLLAKLIVKEKSAGHESLSAPGVICKPGSESKPIAETSLSQLNDFIKKGPEVFQNRCQICHANRASGAPRLTKKLKNSPAFLNTILSRISEKAPDGFRMPPDGAPFSAEDRSALEYYLKSIAHDVSPTNQE